MKCETCGGNEYDPSDEVSHVLCCKVQRLESKLDAVTRELAASGVKTELKRRIKELEDRLNDALDAFAKSEAACIRLELKLKAACCVEHSWRASTFIEYSTPHWVCNNCGKAEGKKYDEWYSQERTTASDAASNTAVLSNESAGPHSEATPVVERRDAKAE